MDDDMEVDPEGGSKREIRKFEMEQQTLVYVKNLGV